MNKRILELAEQATIQEGSHGAFGEPTINEYVDLEKFAELIVAECIELAGNHYDARGAVNDIKQHFGVEL
jgi:hypothetical protein